MSRPTTKTDLLTAAATRYEALNKLIAGLSEQELSTVFDFSDDEKKKEAHWKRDKNLRDVLIHLYEWHQLLLNWVHSNQSGEAKPFLPEPYNWKTYGEMNVGSWKNTRIHLWKKQKKCWMAPIMMYCVWRKLFPMRSCFPEAYTNGSGAARWGPILSAAPQAIMTGRSKK